MQYSETRALYVVILILSPQLERKTTNLFQTLLAWLCLGQDNRAPQIIVNGCEATT